MKVRISGLVQVLCLLMLSIVDAHHHWDWYCRSLGHHHCTNCQGYAKISASTPLVQIYVGGQPYGVTLSSPCTFLDPSSF